MKALSENPRIECDTHYNKRFDTYNYNKQLGEKFSFLPPSRIHEKKSSKEVTFERTARRIFQMVIATSTYTSAMEVEGSCIEESGWRQKQSYIYGESRKYFTYQQFRKFMTASEYEAF